MPVAAAPPCSTPAQLSSPQPPEGEPTSHSAASWTQPSGTTPSPRTKANSAATSARHHRNHTNRSSGARTSSVLPLPAILGVLRLGAGSSAGEGAAGGSLVESRVGGGEEEEGGPAPMRRSGLRQTTPRAGRRKSRASPCQKKVRGKLRVTEVARVARKTFRGFHFFTGYNYRRRYLARYSRLRGL